jgi:hypothetical protein
MTDPEMLDAEAVRVRLPEGWRVEEAGAGVYGYADGASGSPGDFPDFSEIPASFAIRPKGDLWAATWKEPHELDRGLHIPGECSERVRGVRERCVEWVVQRARDADRVPGRSP